MTISPRPSRFLRPLLAAAALITPRLAHAADGTWTANASGLWSDLARWAPGPVADGPGFLADFSTVNITATRTVHLDSPRSIGSLTFFDFIPTSDWILDNNGDLNNTLTLDVAVGLPIVRVINRNVSINLRLLGAAGFEKLGDGTLTLNTQAAYDNHTRISQGILKVGIDNALPANLPLAVFAPGSLELNGHTQQFTGINGTGVITSSAPAAQLIVEGSSLSDISASLQGTLSFSKITPYFVRLLTPATYSGDTSLFAGTLSSGILNALPITTRLSIENDAAFDLNGHDQQIASFLGAGAGLVTNSDLSPSPPATFTVNNSLTVNTAVRLSGNLALTKSAAGLLSLNGSSDYTGDTFILQGTLQFNATGNTIAHITAAAGTSLIVSSTSSITSDGLLLDQFSLNGSHTIRLNGSPTGTVKLSTLTIAHAGPTYSGKLDLTNNKLILQSTSPADKSAKIADLNAAITSGSNGTTWTGNGLTSSTIPAIDPNHYGIALLDNAILNKTSFGGQPVDSNSLLLTIAHLGDANNNGIVDIQDLTIVANNWQQPRNTWTSGDLNRTGLVDIQDLTIVANNWQQTSLFSLYPQPYTLNPSPSPTPEPASLAILSLAAFLLVKPRKHTAGRPS